MGNIENHKLTERFLHNNLLYNSRNMAIKLNYDINPAKFAKQDITRTSLGYLLFSPEYEQIVIPVFQRRYCWPERQLQAWMENVKQGTEKMKSDFKNVLEQIQDTDNIDDFHSVGIGRFKITQAGLICVDGQQRLTTSSLLISSIADILFELMQETLDCVLQQKIQSLVNQCEALLFRDKAQLIRAYESQTNETNIFSQLRLLPSDVDRRPFLKSMIGNRSQDIQLSELEASTESNMFKTKQFFDTYLKQQICKINLKEKVRVIGKIFQSSVLWMKMMVVNVESDVNLSQWFLWLQEKSLMGFASLLTNDNPGVDFRAGDLVKNLLLAAFLEKSVQFQDEIYRQLWTPKMQKLLFSNQLTEKFLDSVENVGSVEESPYDVNGDSDLDGLRIYGRFQAYYENVVKTGEKDLEMVHLDIIDLLSNFSESL